MKDYGALKGGLKKGTMTSIILLQTFEKTSDCFAFCDRSAYPFEASTCLL